MYLVLLIIYKSNVISIKMTLLTKSQEIETLCNNLKKEPFICVDTEFIILANKSGEIISFIINILSYGFKIIN